MGRVGMFSGRLKWFNGEWQLTNPNSRMYGDRASDSAPSGNSLACFKISLVRFAIVCTSILSETYIFF